MNNLPFQNLPFESINSMGQQWIRRFSLALSKETLGQVRGKFGGTIPIPGDSVTLNASDLLGQAQTEQTALREELNKQLDEMLYTKLAESDKAFVDNTDGIVTKTPLKIFVG
jgi:HAMP domain-containing protein